MSGRGTSGALAVDVLARRLHHQIRAAVALDSVHQQAAMLVELDRYIQSGEIEIRATAWGDTGRKPRQTDQEFGAAAFWRDCPPADDWTPAMLEGYRAAVAAYDVLCRKNGVK